MVTVKHKVGSTWVDDGQFTEAEARQFVKRCEYDAHGIDYKVEPVKKSKKVDELEQDSDETSN